MPEQQSSWIVDVGEEDFEREVLERSRERPVVVDFWATWCKPCEAIGPVLERLAEERGGEFVLARVDVDRAPGLAAAYGVQGIPAVKAIRDGRVVLQFVGAIPEPQIREFVEQIRPSEADQLARQGQQAEASDPARAEQLYRKALASEAGHSAASLGLTRLLISGGKDAEARKVLDAAPATADEAEVDRLDAILFLRQAAKEAGSEEDLAKRLKSDPENALLRYQLGLALAGAAKYPEALEMLYSAGQRDKKLADKKVREAMVKVFFAIGARSPLADEYRSKLSRLLY